MARLTDDQLHDLGMAAANLEAAIHESPEVFRQHRPEDHAAAVGDALVMALALKGFVVVFDPVRAELVAQRMETGEDLDIPAVAKPN